jgi:hypothetical protein
LQYDVLSITVSEGSSKFGRSIQCSKFSPLTESWLSAELAPGIQIKLPQETNPFLVLAYTTICIVLGIGLLFLPDWLMPSFQSSGSLPLANTKFYAGTLYDVESLNSHFQNSFLYTQYKWQQYGALQKVVACKTIRNMHPRHQYLNKTK